MRSFWGSVALGLGSNLLEGIVHVLSGEPFARLGLKQRAAGLSPFVFDVLLDGVTGSLWNTELPRHFLSLPLDVEEVLSGGAETRPPGGA